MQQRPRPGLFRGFFSTAVLAAGLTAGLSFPAAATTLTFDFGALGASTSSSGPFGSPCAAGCVLFGSEGAEQWFSSGGVVVGAVGYGPASSGIAPGKYVTQKPGSFGPGETGLGESNTYPTPSDTDFEITTATWLLLDNTAGRAAGYRSVSLTIESIQAGEGANIYEYTGSDLTQLDTTKLTLLATLSNPGTGATTQTIGGLSIDHFLVVQGYTPPGGSSGSDVVLSQQILNTTPPTNAPEPASVAILGIGLAALGVARKRRF